MNDSSALFIKSKIGSIFGKTIRRFFVFSKFVSKKLRTSRLDLREGKKRKHFSLLGRD